MTKYFFILFFVLNPFVSFCQLNESDTVKFQLRVSLTGNYQKGNVDVFAVRSRLDFLYAPVKNFVFKSQNNSLYQEFGSSKADNDIYSRNYLYYKPQHRFYPFAIAYVSANYRRKIHRRYFAGAGLTWQAIKSKNHVLKLSATTVYEETDFNGSSFNYIKYNGADKVRMWRGTLYTGGWSYLAGRRLRLYYDAFYQPAFNDADNFRTQFDIGVDFPVWKGLAFNALYTFTHENLVISNVKKEDKILTFGIAYNLKLTYR